MARREIALTLIQRLEWHERRSTNEEYFLKWRTEPDCRKRARPRFVFIANLTDPERKPNPETKPEYATFFSIPYSFDELCELHYDMENNGDQGALYDQAYHWVLEQLEAVARDRKTTLDQLHKLCVSTAPSSAISGVARKQFFTRLEKVKSFQSWHGWWVKSLKPIEHDSYFNRDHPSLPPHCFSQILIERLKATARTGEDFVTLYELFDEPCKNENATKLFGSNPEQLRTFAWAGIRAILLGKKNESTNST